MELKAVIYEVHDGIALIKLNRPERLNAINRQLVKDMHAAFQEAAADPAVRVVILTGEGRAFCAGDDLKETDQETRDLGETARFIQAIQQLTVDIKTMAKPVIAAVNGYALGGGCEFVIDCDLVVAADDAQFGFPEVGLGLFVTGAVTHLLPKIVGLPKAKELILTCDHIDAQEALRIGLVNRVVPKTELLTTTEQLAAKIASKAPLAVALAKAALDGSSQADVSTALALETAATIATFASEDAREGPRAFVEKREPRFAGR